MASSKAGFYSKLFISIKDAVSAQAPEQNVAFICETIIGFERAFGGSNKEQMRRMINECMEHFGPGTPFENDPHMIPVYVLLGKYSRSLTVSDVFEKLYNKGVYRQSARFYCEWAQAYLDRAASDKARVVLEEGRKRGARPAEALERLRKRIDDECQPGTSLDALKRLNHAVNPPPAAAAAHPKCRKSLFKDSSDDAPAASAPARLPSPVLPPLPSTATAIDNASSQLRSPTAPVDRENPDDAENRNPSPTRISPLPRRRTGGVLVPAAGFQLEDYDFYKEEDTDEITAAKQAANRLNIRNNEPDDTRLDLTVTQQTLSLSSISLPIERGPLGVLNEIPEIREEEFLPATQFFQSFVPLEERDPSTMSAFELKRLSHLRPSIARMVLPAVDAARQAERDMEVAMAKLGIDSPSTSRPI